MIVSTTGDLSGFMTLAARSSTYRKTGTKTVHASDPRNRDRAVSLLPIAAIKVTAYMPKRRMIPITAAICLTFFISVPFRICCPGP